MPNMLEHSYTRTLEEKYCCEKPILGSGHRDAAQISSGGKDQTRNSSHPRENLLQEKCRKLKRTPESTNARCENIFQNYCIFRGRLGEHNPCMNPMPLFQKNSLASPHRNLANGAASESPARPTRPSPPMGSRTSQHTAPHCQPPSTAASSTCAMPWVGSGWVGELWPRSM